MPELPDVQVFKELVDATSLHRRVEDLMLREELVEGTDPQTIRDHLRGSELSETRRHGKHLFVNVDEDGWLRLHLGMTGDLVSHSRRELPEYTQLRIDFTDGSYLAYLSERKLGAISRVSDVDEYIEDHELGPDATADLDLAGFREVLDRRRGSIKGALMNQEALAGLGNLYVDEIVFQAGVHPQSETSTLDDGVIGALFETMHEVVEEAVADRADPAGFPDGWLLAHRDPDDRCPRDRHQLEKIEVSGRSTYLCPHHQKRIG